jgi:hypothetical protein
MGAPTRMSLPAGTLVSASEILRGKPYPRAGQALVGMALKPGQVPAGGVQVGDAVRAVGIPPNQHGSNLRSVVLAGSAPVWSVASGSQGATEVVLLVPTRYADALAAYAASGDLSVIRLGG